MQVTPVSDHVGAIVAAWSEHGALFFRDQSRPGSIAMWDNRSTWHWALNDSPGKRRLMHRITLAGEPLRGVERAPAA